MCYCYNNNMSNLLAFINSADRSFEDSISQLRGEPCNLIIKQGDEPATKDLWVFSYSQTESDSKLPIVQESRGIILERLYDSESWPTSDTHIPNQAKAKIVCYPFNRFFNHGESNAELATKAMNWTTVCGMDKLDGSLIKKYHHNNKWNAATRNGISIHKDPKFLAMWDSVKHKIDESRLDPDCTYMFELVGQDNKIVVDYPNNDLYHIGTRVLSSFKEVDVDIGVQKPTKYMLNNIEQFKELVDKFSPSKQEGIVIVDHKFNRLKLKNETYVTLHHMVGLGNGIPRDQFCLKILLSGEKDEFLAARADLMEKFAAVEKLLDNFVAKIEKIHSDIVGKVKNGNKKEFALEVQKQSPPIPAIHYSLNISKTKSVRQYLVDKYGEGDLKELLAFISESPEDQEVPLIAPCS